MTSLWYKFEVICIFVCIDISKNVIFFKQAFWCWTCRFFANFRHFFTPFRLVWPENWPHFKNGGDEVWLAGTVNPRGTSYYRLTRHATRKVYFSGPFSGTDANFWVFLLWPMRIFVSKWYMFSRFSGTDYTFRKYFRHQIWHFIVCTPAPGSDKWGIWVYKGGNISTLVGITVCWLSGAGIHQSISANTDCRYQSISVGIG